MVHVNNFSYGALNPVLAYVMSCAGCFLGLRCTTRGYACQGMARVRWLALATVAIATTGIWVMHFIAMLGFTIPGQTVTYSVPVTILSMLIALVVVGIGLSIVEFGEARTWSLGVGGLVVGIGVASMHYLGMAAIRTPDTLGYNPVLVVLSVVIAVIAGTAALWAALRLNSAWSALIASLIMGVAVSGMHYTGMAALRVHSAAGLVGTGQGGASAVAFLLPLILGIGIVTFILTAAISLAPTAAEIVEEADLMARIGRPQDAPPPAPDVFQHNGSGPDHEPFSEPGSLFRDHRPQHRHEEG
jgi:NO-binding membrane sensor protein with MHYT domain